MNIQNYKRVLMAKANELRQSQISKDQIAIERNAELLDEIQRTADREIAMASMTIDWRTSSLVAEALKRVDNGEYGICSECEEAISERRLNAIPWAKYCIKCQELADRKVDVFELSEAA
jgi:DnaK suppressor protein